MKELQEDGTLEELSQKYFWADQFHPQINLKHRSTKKNEKVRQKMAEFDYEVVNGRKIRVRPVETVSEVDENGYFHRQPNHFTKGFGPGEN